MAGAGEGKVLFIVSVSLADVFLLFVKVSDIIKLI